MSVHCIQQTKILMTEIYSVATTMFITYNYDVQLIFNTVLHY